MAAPGRSLGKVAQRAERSPAVRRLVLPAQSFIHTETAGAGVLLAAAVVALVWANSPWSESYHYLWEKSYITVDLGFMVIHENLRHWINDLLMALFFFLIGMEVKHELIHGELSSLRRASLPLVAALGGMVVPAGLYALTNGGTEAVRGWGVPMATDIAFALGVLALVGDRLPAAARAFLLAMAAVDDIGAILAIAIFYSAEISFVALGFGAIILAVLVGMRKVRFRNSAYYVAGAFALWLAVFASGMHATIAGVVFGFVIPSRPFIPMPDFRRAFQDLAPRLANPDSGDSELESGVLLGRLEALTVDSEAPLERWTRILHPWSSFLVLPLFALANAGVEISSAALSTAVSSPVTWGVVAGLVLGKLLGIVGFSFVAVKAGFAQLPNQVTWVQLAGIALTAGIGFTVALFIAELAFVDDSLATAARIGILAASLICGAAGYLILRQTGGPRVADTH